MRSLLVILWGAGFLQILIALANLILPKKSNYRVSLSRVEPVIRQVFVVHSAYIVGVLLLFAGITPGFASDLASGKGWGDSRPSRCVCSGGAWRRSNFLIMTGDSSSESIREC
jgi:hypothetical protein